MGMYTQIRGWLNIGSVGRPEALATAESALKRAQVEFEQRGDVDRSWVCHDTWAQQGSNGATWLFIGVEYKNYDKSFDEWLVALLKAFPTAEGRVDYQYEEEGPGDHSRVIKIVSGRVLLDTREVQHCLGYGGQ